MASIGTDSGTVATPSGVGLTAVGPIGRRIRKTAIDIDRLVGRPIQRLAVCISAWLERHAELRHLQSLDDHLLKDIGVSRCDVEREVRGGWY
jgi:uncharacterized protein YjiS (DUF1127 family)